jgi:hypothetical protein
MDHPTLTQGCDIPALPPERASGELAFRVCGTEHDGRIVRLHARKCTIGSGESCTLRLRARGIEPLHCVIIRGEQGTAVRRWSPRTRLNGGVFLDAPLHRGDRIGMGPLELELIESLIEPTPEARPNDARGPVDIEEYSDRLAKLEALLAEQTSAASDERQRRQRVESEVEAAGRRAEEAERALDEARTLLLQYQEQAAAAANLRDEFNRRSEAWDREREELASHLDAARAATVFQAPESPSEEQLAALEAAQSELEQRLERAQKEAIAAAEKADYWEQVALDHVAGGAADEREALTRKIESLESELRRAQDVVLTAAHTEQDLPSPPDDRDSPARDVWEAELGELRKELEETRRSLGAERDDLQAQLVAAQEVSAVRVSPEQFRAERKEWEDTISELRAELEQYRRSREVERARHENELADLRRAIAEKAAAHVPQQEASQDDSASLEVARESLRRQREHQERDLEEARDQLARFKAKLEERAVRLDAREAELNKQAEILAKLKLAAISSDKAAGPSTEVESFAESAADSGALVAPHDNGEVISIAPTLQPESAADVLARMGYAPAWQEEEELPAASAPSPEAPFAVASRASEAPPPRAPEEDDSIEDYMNRLLQRVRGDDVASSYRAPTSTTRTAPPVSRSGPPPQPKPVPSTTASKANIASLLGAAAKPAPATGTMTAEEYVPRSQAPEQSDRLAAMRDLANSSARTAIGRHTRARWLAKTLSRLSMALGAAAACVFLVLFSAASPTLAISGAAIAGAAGGFWFLRGLRDAKNFLRAGRDGHPQAK